MALECRASCGATARSIACSSGLVLLPVRLKNTLATRSRAAPARSIAATVLSKVGAASFPAMAAISASCAFNARAKAGT